MFKILVKHPMTRVNVRENEFYLIENPEFKPKIISQCFTSKEEFERKYDEVKILAHNMKTELNTNEILL